MCQSPLPSTHHRPSADVGRRCSSSFKSFGTCQAVAFANGCGMTVADDNEATCTVPNDQYREWKTFLVVGVVSCCFILPHPPDPRAGTHTYAHMLAR